MFIISSRSLLFSLSFVILLAFLSSVSNCAPICIFLLHFVDYYSKLFHGEGREEQPAAILLV